MHCIQTDVDVVGSGQQLLQRFEIKNAPQHLSIGLHRVHNLHCDNKIKQTRIKCSGTQKALGLNFERRSHSCEQLHDESVRLVDTREGLESVHFESLLADFGQIDFQLWADVILLQAFADLEYFVCDAFRGRT